VSIDTTPTLIAASLASALAIGSLVRVLVPAPRRLRSRLGPYASPHVVSGSTARSGPLSSVFGPIVQDFAHRVGSVVDRTGREATVLKLRQSGWFQGETEVEMLARYRVLQLRTLVSTLAIAVVVVLFIAPSPMVSAVLVGLGLVVGGSRTKGRLERAIESRRDRMRIEIYTVNQLMAMRVRAGGGVIHAVKSISMRGRGEVVAELEEALRLHRAGWPAADAFRRLAEVSPEPFCSRTYRLLASAEERGADLAGALLSLSEDVRETRRESIKRTATKRRAAMLIPTIAILAPVLILFVVAPLPYLITSWR
jgi:tight adherence protein C